MDLVSRLTLEEKQALLGNNMAAVPRLGIKQYNVWSEALHGVLAGANASVGLQGPTSFPGSVALGSTWDPDLLELEASALSLSQHPAIELRQSLSSIVRQQSNISESIYGR